MNQKRCAYCGKRSDHLSREHVIPKNLYPKSVMANSNVQLLTIPACLKCNNSWADDEVHFRNVITLAGDPPTQIKNEIWNTTITRSFSQIDGMKRINDLITIMKPIIVNGQQRHMVFPGQDPRVIRIMRKIIRGLSYYHGLEFPLAEDRIFGDVLRYKIPEQVLEKMEFHVRNEEIIEWGYQILNFEEIQSVWLITFYRTIKFLFFIKSVEAAQKSTPMI